MREEDANNILAAIAVFMLWSFVVVAVLLFGGCQLLAAATAPTQDINRDGYVNEADSPVVRAVASAIPGGTTLLDIFGAIAGGAVVGGTAAHLRARRKVSNAVLSENDTDTELVEKHGGMFGILSRKAVSKVSYSAKTRSRANGRSKRRTSPRNASPRRS